MSSTTDLSLLTAGNTATAEVVQREASRRRVDARQLVEADDLQLGVAVQRGDGRRVPVGAQQARLDAARHPEEVLVQHGHRVDRVAAADDGAVRHSAHDAGDVAAVDVDHLLPGGAVEEGATEVGQSERLGGVDVGHRDRAVEDLLQTHLATHDGDANFTRNASFAVRRHADDALLALPLVEFAEHEGVGELVAVGPEDRGDDQVILGRVDDVAGLGGEQLCD